MCRQTSRNTNRNSMTIISRSVPIVAYNCELLSPILFPEVNTVVTKLNLTVTGSAVFTIVETVALFSPSVESLFENFGIASLTVTRLV